MFQKITLKNGLPVILAPKSGSKSTALFLSYRVGSRNEKGEKLYGISHFIEHLMFKGTKKRPSTLALSKELDGIGADYNAYTSKDHTAYHIKVNAENIAIACDILSDMLYNSLFDSDKLEQEKGVILEEIKMYEDQPLQYAEILFEQQIFKDSALAHNIAGTRKSVQGIKKGDIVEYLEKFYAPGNAVLVVSGQITPQALKLIKKYFDRRVWGKQYQPALKLKTMALSQKVPQLLLHNKKTEQTHLALGFGAYAYNDPRLNALYLLSVILGGNMSSRLFIDVREKKGLCYYIRAQADVYQDTGDLLIRAGLDTNKLEQALQIIVQDLKAIKKSGVTSEELNKAKKFLQGRLTLQLEELNDLAEFYGREFLLADKLQTPEEKIKKILAVTKEQVNKVSCDIFQSSKANLVLISPYAKKQKLLNILKF